ncbi:MAG: flagellar basal body-associated FliL family protein [Desulfovibrionales bacterium]|nr:flagellar basal body-associated FliL family protein [Desulfovibrionales bacterium]
MAENDDSQDKKVTLDQSELDIDRAKDKVELDLDDAPFLEEEEEEDFDEVSEQEGEESSKDPVKIDQEISKAPGKDKKKLYLSIALFLLIVLLITLYLIFFSKKNEVPPQDPEATQEQTAVEPDEPVLDEIINFEPFMVEMNTEESIRFLHTRFSLPAHNERLAGEIRDKNIILRDAIYYYLNNQETIFLQDKDNTDKIKNDLLSVVNQYLSSGNIKDILIEEYLVK